MWCLQIFFLFLPLQKGESVKKMREEVSFIKLQNDQKKISGFTRKLSRLERSVSNKSVVFLMVLSSAVLMVRFL